MTLPFAPVPSLGGSAIRARAVLEALARDFDLTVVCSALLSDTGMDEVRRICDGLGVAVVFVRDDAVAPWSGRIAPRVRAIASALSARAESWSVGPSSAVVAELVRDSELFWAYRTVPFRDRRMPMPVRGAVVVDLDDLEERIVGGDRTVGPIRRRVRIRRIMHARRRLLSKARFALVCSTLDASRLDAPCPVRVLPNTYLMDRDPSTVDVHDTSGASTVLFVGKMDYAPNRLGAEWLLREVWPIVRRRVPTARLVIVGEGSEDLAHSAPDAGTELRGWIEDISPILGSASVVTAPIPFGSGTRLKIIEGLAHRRPVVSTSAGAEGLDVVDGATILIADDAIGFAHHIVHLLEDRARAQEIGDAGRALFDDRYSFERFGTTVVEIAHEAIDRSNTTPSATGRVRPWTTRS